MEGGSIKSSPRSVAPLPQEDHRPGEEGWKGGRDGEKGMEESKGRGRMQRERDSNDLG